MSVLVLGRRRKPLMPCSEERARLLLERGRAPVARRYPFTIRLIDRTVEESAVQPVRIKIDPGSKTTGFAIVGEDEGETVVLALAELAHRGARIRDRLTARRTFRRRRRAKLRYRSKRFDNRRRPAAAGVGEVQALTAWRRPILSIKATGRGAYQRIRLDRFGFPRGTLMRAKRVGGFQTGDMVRAVIRAGKKAATYFGRVAIRASKSFIQTADGVLQVIHAKHCELLARGDGYAYALTGELLSAPGLKPGVSRSPI